VVVGAEPKVTYGHINPERARRIMQEHVAGGKVLTDWLIPA
jgi:(2Fe-2S) ferredoxin